MEGRTRKKEAGGRRTLLTICQGYCTSNAPHTLYYISHEPRSTRQSCNSETQGTFDGKHNLDETVRRDSPEISDWSNRQKVYGVPRLFQNLDGGK